MPSQPWPSPPDIIDRTNFNGQITTSTTGEDLWGGGTTKPISAPGLYLLHFSASIRHNTQDFHAYFRLEKSTDGVIWSDADPANANWHAHQFHGANLWDRFAATFVYKKTNTAQEYLRLRWKTNGGTLRIVDFTGFAAFGGAVHLVLHPLWVT